MWSPEQRHGAIGDIHARDLGAHEVRPQVRGRDLQPALVRATSRCCRCRPGGLAAQDLAPLLGRTGHEGQACCSAATAKRALCSRQVDLGDEAVGRLDLGDAGQRQLLDQPVLQRAEGPLRAPAGLAASRPGYARSRDRPAPGRLGSGWLFETLPPAFGRVKVVAGPVAVDRRTNSPLAIVSARPRKARCGALLSDQKAE